MIDFPGNMWYNNDFINNRSGKFAIFGYVSASIHRSPTCFMNQAEAFKAYLASEFEARNTVINILEYGIPSGDEYMEAIVDFIHVEMAEYFHVKVGEFAYNGTVYARINVEYTMSEAEYASAKSAWDAAVARGKNPLAIWVPEHDFGDYFCIYGMWFKDDCLYCMW
jgi:hypothetical protein